MNGWETWERVRESGDFESRQRVLVAEPVVEPSEAGARVLGVTYWQAVDRFTRGGVRASWTGRGQAETTRRCDAAHVRDSRNSRSTAGSSVAGTRSRVDCSRSEPAAPSRSHSDVEGDQHELSVTVEEYLPRLAARAGAPPWTGMLYAKGQSPLHAAVSRRYFELLLRSQSA